MKLERIRELRAKLPARVGGYATDLDSALAAAESLARLEEWLRPIEPFVGLIQRDDDGQVFVRLETYGKEWDEYGQDIRTALTRALDQAEGKP